MPFSELPFAVGQSPFRIKGVAYRETLEAHKRLPGGKDAVRAALPDDALRAYYDQNFLPSGWYDLFAMLHFDQAGAQVAGEPLVPYLQRASAAQGNSVTNGIYKVLLTFLSPKMIAKFLPKALNTYYDFSKIQTTTVSPNHVVAVVSEVPEGAAEWFLVCGSAFVQQVLQNAGATSPSVTWRPPRRAGVARGLPTVEAQMDLQWG